MIYRSTPEVKQPYPPANLWTRVEISVEPEPELIDHSIIRLPANWPEERRAAWLIRLDAQTAAS